VVYVLAGGRGSRLMEVTDIRAKPAVYFGGKSRIIDSTLSNALNSGIRRVSVATHYKSHSLIRHMQRGWDFFRPSATRALTSCRPARAVRRPAGTPERQTQFTRVYGCHRELRAALYFGAGRRSSTKWITSRCCSSTAGRAQT
jgi:ADP-glucose pyrophosphorylase